MKSGKFNRDVQLALLMRHKWEAEIEKAVDKVKLGLVPGERRCKTNRRLRHLWYKSGAIRKKRCEGPTITRD